MAQDNMDFNRRRSFGNIPQYGLVKGTVAPGFVDYGQVLKKNIDIDDIIKARKLKEDEYAENIANSPADIDVAKVPDAYEAGLTDYLTELKMEYSEGAKLLRDNRVGSEAYKRGQELIRNSKGFMANLDKEYSALQSASLEDIKNIQQDMYSSGNDESNQINSVSMLLKGQLSPDKIYYQDGKMYIRGGGDDGKDIAFSDLRLRFLKDSASMGAMTTSYRGLVDNAIKSGRRFNDVTDGALINDILTKANSQGIRSIAYDYNFPIPGDVVSYAKSDRAQKIADTQFNGDKNWIRDINNSDILRNDMLSYFNDVFKNAINAEADAYDDRLEQDFTRRQSLRTPNADDGRSKYTQETIDGVNSIINNPINTLKGGGLELTKGMSDFDSKNYEEKYFKQLALNTSSTKENINVLNFSDARQRFLKDKLAINQAIEKIKSDAISDTDVEPLLNFMASAMDGSYNKNLGSGKNYFISQPLAYVPEGFFTEVKKDEDGMSYRQLTQKAQDLLTEIGYISSDYTEQVDVGTKRYKNFEAFISDVKDMTFNRFVPGTGNLGPAKMFVFRRKKDGVDLRGLQGSILTEEGRDTLFNSIIASGLYTASELRASGGDYVGPLSGNYNYTGSN